MMQPVADALKTDHTTLLIDFPGHGESGRPPEPWGVPEYADALLELLKCLSFLPCSVVAHSFGCRVAAWLEAENPGMFNRIVFTGAAGIRPKPSEEAQKRTAKYRKLRDYCETARKIPLIGKAAAGWEDKLRQKYGSRDYNALDEEMRKTFVRVINQDLTELYARFHASTLLLWGDADTETPLWMARVMEQRIPDAGLVILEGGTHFAYLEQISRFNTIVRHFLKEDK
jgi:pimeloyl-ACP methyl ester carboxylesterase